MKKYLIINALVLSVITAKAQNNTVKTIPNDTTVYSSAQIQASYPGGLSEFKKFLTANILYPDIARTNNTQGMVYLSFIIEKDGLLSNFKVMRGVSPEIDNEAVRVMRESPKWSPAKINNVVIRQRFVVPMKFALVDRPAITKLSNDIYLSIEYAPSFPGGLNEFYKFFSLNIVYPQSALKANEQGTVFLIFFVEKDGNVSGVKVSSGVSAAIDSEAVRVMRTSPKWIPLKQNGVPVRSQFSVPINFALPKKL